MIHAEPKWGKSNERLVTDLFGSRKDDSVVMVKNEESVQTSLSASEFLGLYLKLGGKGSQQAAGSAVYSWLRGCSHGVFGLQNATAAIAGEAFKRITGKRREDMTQEEAETALRNVRSSGVSFVEICLHA
jgi:hypothetical protein